MSKAFALVSFAIVVSFSKHYFDNNLSEDAILIATSIFLAAGVMAFNR